MGLGSDLMRFFASDPTTDRPIKEFHESHSVEHPHPAVNLRAAERLCDAGRLYHGELAFGPRVLSARFRCVRPVAAIQADIDYGTYDFIVDGLAAVRSAFDSSVLHVTIETTTGLSNGTAFAITPTVLLTARHCVDSASSAEQITIIQGSTQLKPFNRVLAQGTTDVAALILSAPLAVRTFRVREPVMLEQVLTLGFPTLQGLHPSLMASSGELSGVATAYLDGNPYWVTTCAMTGGSSGGPVVGADGMVVGVVSGLPATDAGIDPGRFGLMAACTDPLREIAANVGLGAGLDIVAPIPTPDA